MITNIILISYLDTIISTWYLIFTYSLSCMKYSLTNNIIIIIIAIANIDNVVTQNREISFVLCNGAQKSLFTTGHAPQLCSIDHSTLPAPDHNSRPEFDCEQR